MAVPALPGGFMLWSGSSPLTIVRHAMWGLLLLTGVAWLAIGWSVLRLEPADIADVAGPVLLFAAATEVVRAVAGPRTWWLNAGMALLFAATGAVLMTDRADTWTTPAALIGWYLLVRGAADIAISMMPPSVRSGAAVGRLDGTRETDRVWGLLTVVGLTELGLGFFAAGSFARTAEAVAVILGGAAVIRGVADLVSSLRLREASAIARAERLLELPPERAVGVAGYAAGITDFEEAPSRSSRPRHRAVPRGSAAGMTDLSGAGSASPLATATPNPGSSGSGSFHDEVLRTTADLDAMLALAGVTGAATPGAAAQAAEAAQVEVPDTAEGAELPGQAQLSAAPVRPEGAATHGPEGVTMHPDNGSATAPTAAQTGAAMPIWQHPAGSPAAAAQQQDDQGAMPMDPAARAARAAMPHRD
ncbi:hypothetical protein AB0J80_07425 [Actinoplanes sp. NPDC049548]|uniref:HdeD family acid-resistance protein n=1 Tax=Actinoplanes sp. NPDC049548 TaxID=3155152 RepID=UPI0034217D6B